MVPWAHPSPQPNQHFDRMSRFCRAHYCDRLTDRPTGHNTQLVTIGRIYKCSTMMRPNNSTGDNVYGAVIMARPLQEFTRFIWWMPTERQMVANPQTKSTRLLPSTSTIAIYYYYSAWKSWYSFYHPIEGGKLNRPRHCSKGAQAMSKAVYHGGCRDKHKCPRLAGEIRTRVLTQRSQACYH